jgi:hypothetical protein
LGWGYLGSFASPSISASAKKANYSASLSQVYDFFDVSTNFCRYGLSDEAGVTCSGVENDEALQFLYQPIKLYSITSAYKNLSICQRYALAY